ncbi:hypothetical protein SPHI_26340 [Sphingomonas jeddahensis]|uniref:Uncharacterized protein n=1 Tax=Sphingomonas jeddahensis TaxID=1915074 RepID=A0A1V2ERP9_9SPHN|nr:hypothetical protein SPHI_26340 [Sphingomonas jeddahensis]
MTVQPFSSRFTRTDRLSPLEVLLLDADERPSLDEEAETELLDDELPDARELALALFLPSSTIVVSIRPSAR